jgi:hypothetical protein
MGRQILLKVYPDSGLNAVVDVESGVIRNLLSNNIAMHCNDELEEDMKTQV